MTFSFNNQINEEIRVSKLRIERSEVQTPFWILNNVERKKLIKGLNLINNEIPTLPFNEIVKDIGTQDEMYSYLGNPKLYSKFQDNIASECRRNTNNMLQIRRKDNIPLSSTHLNQILELQASIDPLSVLIIPDPIIGKSGLMWEMIMAPILGSAKSFVDTSNFKTFMPMISLNQPIKVIKRKVHWLISKQTPSIGLRAHGSFNKRLIAALEIIKQRKPDTWVHLFDLSKKYYQISNLHLSPLYGVDTISLKKGYSRGFSQSRVEDTGDFPTPEGISLTVEASEEIPTYTPKDLFESRALGFFSEDEQNDYFGHRLNCRCPICSRAHFSLEELTQLLSQTERKALLQVHENTAFPMELNKLVKATIDNQTEEYYKEKTLINQNLEKLSRIFSIFN